MCTIGQLWQDQLTVLCALGPANKVGKKDLGILHFSALILLFSRCLAAVFCPPSLKTHALSAQLSVHVYGRNSCRLTSIEGVQAPSANFPVQIRVNV